VIFSVLKMPLAGLGLLALAASLTACVSIPKEAYVVSGQARVEHIESKAECSEAPLGPLATPGSSHDRGIDPAGFTLFTWNVMKGGREGWDDDFLRLAGRADLLALQEASLSEALRRVVHDGRRHWDLSAAFLIGNRETGVLTGAPTAPADLCVSRFAEPLVPVPKTVLVSLYPLAGTSRFLLVANVHLINFTLDTDEYREQLRQLEILLSSHRGPLLLTGDFNTWSGRRMAAVEKLAVRLGLRGVEFAEGDRASFLGRSVDHVFFRGLETVAARAERVSTSAHTPLLVTFRVPEERDL